MRIVVGVLAFCCSCGDNTPGLPLVVPYAPIIAQYRVGSGAWETALGASDADGSTQFDLPIDDDFELVVACRAPNGSVVTQEALGTLDDWPVATEPWSCPSMPAVEPTATITGMTDQLADIFAQRWAGVSFLPPGFSYEFTVDTGLVDLVGLAIPRVVIRHAQTIETDTTEPPIAFATEGGILALWTPTFDGQAPDEGLELSTTLVTANGTIAQLEGIGMTVPPTLLATGDRHHFDATLTSGAGMREVDEWYAIKPTMSYTLLAPLGNVVFPSARSVSWSSLPDGIADATFITSDRIQLAVVTVGSGWLAKHGATSLSFDTDVPGLDPSWLPADTLGGQELSAYQVSYDPSRDASLYLSSSVGSWVVFEDP